MFRRGFTLIELMIGVALVGALVALAIPNYVSMQYKAKRAEVNINSAGLFDALSIWASSEYDGASVFDTGFNPNPAPLTGSGKVQRDWNAGITTTQAEAWGQLGWSPDGAVRCSYQAFADGSVDGGYYYALGTCDLDGNLEEVLMYRYGPGFQDLVDPEDYPTHDVFPDNF